MELKLAGAATPTTTANKKLLPAGRLALEIRGAISALESYFEADRFDLAVNQRIRLNQLSDQLEQYKIHPELLENNLIAHDWVRIAETEFKDWRTTSQTAVFPRGFWLK